MDVAEFFSELRRMCKSSSDCAKCQYHGNKCDNANEIFEKNVNHAAKAGTKAQPVSMMKIAWFRWRLLKHRKAGAMWRMTDNG